MALGWVLFLQNIIEMYKLELDFGVPHLGIKNRVQYHRQERSSWARSRSYCQLWWSFLKWGYPKSSRMFHEMNYPFWGTYPQLWEPPSDVWRGDVDTIWKLIDEFILDTQLRCLINWTRTALEPFIDDFGHQTLELSVAMFDYQKVFSCRCDAQLAEFQIQLLLVFGVVLNGRSANPIWIVICSWFNSLQCGASSLLVGW